MRILGIDPALSSLGWGIIELDSPRIKYVASGTVKTDTKLELHKRLAIISCAIEELIKLHQPNAISMEETFVNTNAISSLKLGYVRGAIMALIGKTDIPYFEYLPNKIKKTIVGVGHAEKEQVKHMVNIVISNCQKSITFDEADALAIAYTCLVNAKL